MAFTLIDEEKTQPSENGKTFTLMEEEPSAQPDSVVDKAGRFLKQPFLFNLLSPEQQQDLSGQIHKGAGQGIMDLLNLVGLGQGAIQSPLTFGLLDKEGRQETATPGMKAQAEMLTDPGLSDIDFAALAGGDDDLIGLPMLPGQRKGLRKITEELPEEGMPQEAVRRAVRSGPFGPVALAAEYTGLAAKEGVKAVGGGEGLQTAADILVGLFGPQIANKMMKIPGIGPAIEKLIGIPKTPKFPPLPEKLPAAVEEMGTKLAEAEVVANPRQFHKRIQKIGSEAIEEYGNITGRKAKPTFEKTPTFEARKIENQIIQETKDATLKTVSAELPNDQKAWTHIKDTVNEALQSERKIYSDLYKSAERASKKILTTPENSISVAKDILKKVRNISTKTTGQTTVETALQTSLKDLGLKNAKSAEEIAAAVIKKYGLEASSPKIIDQIVKGISIEKKSVKISNLMDLKRRLNGIINYEDLDRSVKDLLRPLVKAVKLDIEKGLGKSEARVQWDKAERSFAETSRRFGKTPIESLRKSDVPENIANQFKTGSAAQQLKDALRKSPKTWSVVEQQLAKRISGMSTKEAMATLGELSPHLSKKAKDASQKLINMGDKLTTAGAREAARGPLLNDIQNALSTGSRPEYTLNMMKTPAGYQNVKNLLNKSPKGKDIFKNFGRQLADDMFESIKSPNGSIDWSKAANLLKDPHVKKIIKDAYGEKSLKFLQQLEKFGKNITKNLEMFTKQAPQSIREQFISSTGLFLKALLATVVGGKAALFAYLGVKVVPKMSKSIYFRMLSSPRVREAVKILSDEKSWRPEKIIPIIQKIQGSINKEDKNSSKQRKTDRRQLREKL